MSAPLFFYGHSAKVQYNFLSQWHACAFADAEEHNFTSAEQWMMWRKAVVFGDEETAQAILVAKSPGAQKALGRSVGGFDEAKWDAVKLQIVEDGNYLKFTQNDGLKRKLLETGDAELVEASPRDRVWGIGFGPEDARRAAREEWGENLLGKALVSVRERIRREESQTEKQAEPTEERDKET